MKKTTTIFTACPRQQPLTIHASGFTLIEVLMVLIITAILASIVAPNFYDFSARSTSKKVIQDLSSLVRFTRNHALHHQNTTVLCPSTDGKQCEQSWESGALIFEDKNDDQRLNGDDVILNFNSPLASKGTITWTALRNYLSFSGQGLSANSAGSFIYCPNNKNEQYAHALIVSFSGKIRFAEDNNQDGIKESGNNNNIACL